MIKMENHENVIKYMSSVLPGFLFFPSTSPSTELKFFLCFAPSYLILSGKTQQPTVDSFRPGPALSIPVVIPETSRMPVWQQLLFKYLLKE